MNISRNLLSPTSNLLLCSEVLPWGFLYPTTLGLYLFLRSAWCYILPGLATLLAAFFVEILEQKTWFGETLARQTSTTSYHHHNPKIFQFYRQKKLYYWYSEKITGRLLRWHVNWCFRTTETIKYTHCNCHISAVTSTISFFAHDCKEWDNW